VTVAPPPRNEQNEKNHLSSKTNTSQVIFIYYFKRDIYLFILKKKK